MQAHRTIPNNKPDTITCYNEKRKCMLIDVAISGEKNVIKKVGKKDKKYKDFATEIQHTWNIKAEVIPEITGPPGTT